MCAMPPGLFISNRDDKTRPPQLQKQNVSVSKYIYIVFELDRFGVNNIYLF